MSLILPIKDVSSMGPDYVQKTREKYSHDLTETCCLTDQVVQDSTSSLKMGFDDFTYTNPIEKEEGLDAESWPKYYRKIIEHHVTMRVSCFFQQLIACNKTGLHFENEGALSQGASATPIRLKNGTKISRQAAHSSTLPCLIAYDSKKWKEYESTKDGTKPKGYVFLKGTDYYRTQNSTINLPKSVNDADLRIDDKKYSVNLRKEALQLVNQVAQGTLRPEQGLIKFVTITLEAVSTAKKCEKDKKKILSVLALYEKYLLKIEPLVKEKTFSTAMLHLFLRESESVDPAILDMHYAIIQDGFFKQYTVIKKIETVKNEILCRIKKTKEKTRKPNLFDTAFLISIVKSASELGKKKDPQRVQKLFNFSVQHLSLQKEGSRQLERSQKILGVYQKKIDSLMEIIIKDMATFRKSDKEGLGERLKTVRALQRLSQKALGEKIQKKFHDIAASQSTISKIENGKKELTEKEAECFGVALGAPSLILPQFFYS